MQISDKGLSLIKHFEGCVLTAYRDSVGIWTIGYGHTGEDAEEGRCISQAKAEEILNADLARFEHGVEDMAFPCTQNQFDALVSFAFNLGLGALKSSPLLRKHKSGDFKGAAGEFLRWNRAGGKVLAGLARRRAAEAELYLRP